ncbi:MAG: cation:proton antiporter [Deltaproteobacteria bacterium]|nr:cation:proton antiporter [Deltaproteobacteria bacterium]
MHNIDLILTLTGGLAAALLFGYITNLLKLSPIVGYLIAGIAVGQHTPGFIADQHIAEQLAEIGVILLMFGVGLHFHLSELLAVKKIAIPGAITQSCVATVLGALLMKLFGWDWTSGIVFGLAIAVASTVVLTRVLADNRDLHTPTGHIAVGWLVVEDLFTVFVLVVLPSLAVGAGAGLSSIATAAGMATLKIAALVALIFLLGGKVIPWMLGRIARSNSRELFTLTILVVALGISVGAAKLFDVSMALGAFLAGMVVGRSDFSARAAAEALPMRDAFAVLFFVSIGMLLDPISLWQTPLLLLSVLLIVVVGKAIAALAIVLALGYPLKVGLGVAVALSQIGEFSFIVATLGKNIGVLPEMAMDILVATAIVSITINPILYRLVDPFERWIREQAWLANLLPTPSTKISESDSEEHPRNPHRAVVIGYGVVGQAVTRLLRENGVTPTLIELNVETVKRLQQEGLKVVYGDASQRSILEAAGVESAGSLILSASSISAQSEVIRNAQELNPDIFIIARTTHLKELAALQKLGVQDAFSGEGEAALGVVEALLKRLGATPDQIESERQRVRASFLVPQAVI